DHVDATGLLEGRPDCAVALGDLGQFRRDRARGRSGRSEFLGDTLQPVLEVIHDEDLLGALFRKAKGGRSPDPAPAPCNEDDLSSMAILVQRRSGVIEVARKIVFPGDLLPSPGVLSSSAPRKEL